MAKITGLGGVFYVVADPEATRTWYREKLCIDGEYGSQLNWSEEAGGLPYSLISHFKNDDYIKPGTGDFMINLRVDDLDGLLNCSNRATSKCWTVSMRAMENSRGCSIPTA